MFDAVILAGGQGRRLGTVDKALLTLGADERPLLSRVLAAVAAARRVVVVGPMRRLPESRPVLWRQEDPPGAGPLAGVAAALPDVTADLVLLAAADLPWLEPAVRPLLDAAQVPEVDGAVLVDGDGRANWLAAAWRTAALREAVRVARSSGRSAMSALALDARLSPIADQWRAGQDCDTWSDVEDARRRARREAGA